MPMSLETMSTETISTILYEGYSGDTVTALRECLFLVEASSKGFDAQGLGVGGTLVDDIALLDV
jgi:hypothetical protein